MLRKYFPHRAEEVKGSTQLRSSNIRGLRDNILEHFPNVEPYLDDIIPKKAVVNKSTFKPPHNHLGVYYIGNKPLFIQDRDGPILPHLRLAHECKVYLDPIMLKTMQVDRGAIKHILSGAHIMCPGLTSPGGRLCQANKGEVVGIVAEGKQTILAIGVVVMNTEEM